MNTLLRALSLLALLGMTLSVIGSTPAQAHPFSTDEYSYRSMIKVTDKGLQVLVVLEMPIPVVAAETGITKEDSEAKQRRKVDRYNESVWQKMAEGLTLTVDGQPFAGEWLAIEHPQNGKAGDGFFVYMVAFAAEDPAALPERFELRIQNVGYPDEKMVYTGSVTTKEPWSVAESVFVEVLGDNAELPLDDPDRWTRDASLRDVRAVLQQ